MRVRGLLIIALLMALGAALAPRAAAQGNPEVFTVDVNWTLTPSANGYTQVSGGIHESVQTFTFPLNPLPDDTYFVGFTINNASPSANFNFYIDGNAESTNSTLDNECIRINEQVGAAGVGSSLVCDAAVGYNPRGVNFGIANGAVYQPSAMSIQHYISCPSSGGGYNCPGHPDYNNSSTIETLIFFGFPPEDKWVRPLSQADDSLLAELSTVGGATPPTFVTGWKDQTVYAFSDGLETALVHAPYDGRIVAIDVFTNEGCTYRLPAGTCQMLYEDKTWTLTDEYDKYLVTISTLDGTVYTSYLVSNAPAWIREGDFVLAGCVMGETIAAASDDPAIADIAFTLARAEEPGTGVVELYDRLTVYSNTDAPCSDLSTECLNANNEMAESAGVWQLTAGAQWATERGVWLAPGASVSQILGGLDPEVSYDIGILALGVGELELEISGVSTIIPVNASDYGASLIARLTPPPDSIHIFRITAPASNTESIYILSACLAFNVGPLPPTECFFANHDFKSGFQGWTYTNPVGINANEYAQVGHGGNFSQIANLYPDEEDLAETTEYKIDVYFGPVIGDYNAAWDYTINWSYGSQTGSLPVLDVPYENNSSISGAGRFTIEITEYSTEAFVFEASLIHDGTPTDAIVQIDKVCLQPSSGKTFPGYPEGPTLGEFVLTCNSMPSPPSVFNLFEPWAWLQWLWRSMWTWAECNLLPPLQAMWEALMNIWQIGIDFTAYLSLVFSQMGGWFGDLVWFIGGLFNNLISILGELLGGVWESLEIIFDVLLEVMARLISFIQLLISMVLEMITRYGSFRNAWENVDPITIPAFDCDNQETPTSTFCKAIWALDNTVFATGTPGLILINIVIGWLAAHLIIWSVGEIKRTTRQAGTST